MLTQLGTAAGMLVFVPLGDTHQRRSLAFWLLLASSVALAFFACAHDVRMLALAGLMIGLTSSAVHVLVPFAAHLAPEDQKGSAVGIVLSGLLLGILLARTVSGYTESQAVSLRERCPQLNPSDLQQRDEPRTEPVRVRPMR